MAKIYVGCKLPNGLIMELIAAAPQATGIIPAEAGPRVHLNGANSKRIARVSPESFNYGITLVEEEFANKWFEANKNMKFVREGLVFKVKDEKSAESEARNGAKILTGVEPLKPEGGDNRRPLGVEADKDQLRRLGAA